MKKWEGHVETLLYVTYCTFHNKILSYKKNLPRDSVIDEGDLLVSVSCYQCTIYRPISDVIMHSNKITGPYWQIWSKTVIIFELV